MRCWIKRKDLVMGNPAVYPFRGFFQGNAEGLISDVCLQSRGVNPVYLLRRFLRVYLWTKGDDPGRAVKAVGKEQLNGRGFAQRVRCLVLLDAERAVMPGDYF